MPNLLLKNRGLETSLNLSEIIQLITCGVRIGTQICPHPHTVLLTSQATNHTISALQKLESCNTNSRSQVGEKNLAPLTSVLNVLEVSSLLLSILALKKTTTPKIKTCDLAQKLSFIFFLRMTTPKKIPRGVETCWGEQLW